MELLLAVFFRQSFRCSFNRDLKSCQGELDRGVVGHVFSMICWDFQRLAAPISSRLLRLEALEI